MFGQASKVGQRYAGFYGLSYLLVIVYKGSQALAYLYRVSLSCGQYHTVVLFVVLGSNHNKRVAFVIAHQLHQLVYFIADLLLHNFFFFFGFHFIAVYRLPEYAGPFIGLYL